MQTPEVQKQITDTAQKLPSLPKNGKGRSVHPKSTRETHKQVSQKV